MPINLLSTPQLIQSVYNPIYTKVSSDKTSEEAFNFIFDLYINGNFVNRDRLLPRPATTEAVYSPARILESYLSYDKSHNYINSSASTNCIDSYEVVCGEEYVNPFRFYDNAYVSSASTLSGYTLLYTTGATANPYVSGDTIYVVQDVGYTSAIYNGVFTVLSADTTGVIIDILHSVTTPVNGGLIYYSDRRKTIYTGSTRFSGYSFNSVIQYEEIPTWDYLAYIPLSGSTSARFLTNQPSEVKIRENERASIGYFNYGQFSGDSAVNGILVTTYQKSGGTTSNLIVSSADAYSGTNTTTNGLINEFGVGTYNLNQIPNSEIYGVGQPLVDFNRDYKYDIQLYNFSALPCSEVKTYLLDDECTKYEPVRFMFLNALGQFDYFTATLLSRENINISRTSYQKVLEYNYQVGERGKTLLGLDAQQTYTVTSNWITEDTCTWLMELFLSTEVYVLNSDGSLIPIVIDNSSVEPKKRVNDQLLNYTFNYSKAITKNTSRN